MQIGIKLNNKNIPYYQSPTTHLVGSYTSWPIQLKTESLLELYFSFLNNTEDKTFQVNGFKLYRIPAFDNIKSRL